jgi:hypothetical protein
MTAHNFNQSGLREKVTDAVMEMLAHLSETERNIFVWNHYRSYTPKQIAEILKYSLREVEVVLDEINAKLYQRARSLVDHDPQREPSTDGRLSVPKPPSETRSLKAKSRGLVPSIQPCLCATV